MIYLQRSSYVHLCSAYFNRRTFRNTSACVRMSLMTEFSTKLPHKSPPPPAEATPNQSEEGGMFQLPNGGEEGFGYFKNKHNAIKLQSIYETETFCKLHDSEGTTEAVVEIVDVNNTP